MKKILIFGFPHSGTTILKSIIGHIDNVEEIINESKIQRILKTFEIEQQIEQQTNPRCRLISILRWIDYQLDEQQSEQQVNNTMTDWRRDVNKTVIHILIIFRQPGRAAEGRGTARTPSSMSGALSSSSLLFSVREPPSA